jgi:hypothetical protein
LTGGWVCDEQVEKDKRREVEEGVGRGRKSGAYVGVGGGARARVSVCGRGTISGWETVNFMSYIRARVMVSNAVGQKTTT